jgi:pimeloyl-ACP methyl ester carboxylesterase
MVGERLQSAHSIRGGAVPFADVNAVRLYYEEQGIGEPLICVMGLATSSSAWVLQVPAFAARHRTVTFDNRDVGQSTRMDAPYAIGEMAEDVLALADHLDMDEFHLLGVSMGGAIAQHVALGAPGRVRTLTLGVTWAGAGAYAVEKTRLWALEAERFTREEFIDTLMLINFSEAFYENAEGVAFVRQMMRDYPHHQEPDAFRRQAEASAGHDLRGRLDALTMPVHVIAGEHDIVLPHWKSEELAAQIPGARLTIVPKAPHGLNIERAEEFNDAVLGFIAEHSQAPAPA